MTREAVSHAMMTRWMAVLLMAAVVESRIGSGLVGGGSSSRSTTVAVRSPKAARNSSLSNSTLTVVRRRVCRSLWAPYRLGKRIWDRWPASMTRVLLTCSSGSRAGSRRSVCFCVFHRSRALETCSEESEPEPLERRRRADRLRVEERTNERTKGLSLG